MQTLFIDGKYKQPTKKQSLLLSRIVLYDDMKYKINMLNLRKKDIIKSYLESIKDIDKQLKSIKTNSLTPFVNGVDV